MLEGDKLYLLPVQGSDTQWYRNVLKNPSIRIDERGAEAEFRADPVTDAKTVKSVVEKFRVANRLALPLRALLGDKQVVTEFPPATGSEDVHLLLLGPNTDVPFCFLIVGVADPQVFATAVKAGKGMPYSAHNPNFVVDLKAIPVGTKIATVSMLELLGKR